MKLERNRFQSSESFLRDTIYRFIFYAINVACKLLDMSKHKTSTPRAVLVDDELRH